MLVQEGMTALDALGPHEILSRLPGTKVLRVAKKPGIVKTDSADLRLTAEHGISDVSKADILLVPGAGTATTLRDEPAILETSISRMGYILNLGFECRPFGCH